jgi:uncharacterized protein with PIN domain
VTRLLCDSMLGRLARWLRLLGCDAPLVKRPPARPGPGEVLLTRRRAWQGRPGVLLVAHDRLEDQLRQVIAELDLTTDPAHFFSRCLDCNLPVESISKDQAAGRVPDFTLDTAESFTQCPGCGKVFWPGSHGKRAAARVQEILGSQSA